MASSFSQKRLIFAISIALLAVTLLFAAYKSPATNTDAKNNIVHEISAIYPHYSIEKLVKHADVIAVGEIAKQDAVLEIEPVVGGETRLFTDFIVRLTEVYKDERQSATNEVLLRVQGGENAEKIVIDTEMPKLAAGDQYLFFLAFPKSSGGYTADDGHMTLVGGPQGLFKLSDGANQFANADTTINKEELTSMAKNPQLKLAKEEADPYYGLKQNLQSGFITEEEYNKSVSELNKYATIVNKN